MKYFIRRKFNLINQPFELQYVSSFDDGRIGYDKHVKFALKLDQNQLQAIIEQFEFIRCEYAVEEVPNA